MSLALGFLMLSNLKCSDSGDPFPAFGKLDFFLSSTLKSYQGGTKVNNVTKLSRFSSAKNFTVKRERSLREMTKMFNVIRY